MGNEIVIICKYLLNVRGRATELKKAKADCFKKNSTECLARGLITFTAGMPRLYNIGCRTIVGSRQIFLRAINQIRRLCDQRLMSCFFKTFFCANPNCFLSLAFSFIVLMLLLKTVTSIPIIKRRANNTLPLIINDKNRIQFTVLSQDLLNRIVPLF